MFNNSFYNGVPSRKIPNTIWNKFIKFWDFFLHWVNGISVNSLEFLGWKNIQVQSESFANDGEIFNRREVVQRVKISGSIRKNSRGELLNFLDNFKIALSKDREYLTITEWEWSRRIRCTATSYDFKEESYTVDWIEFSVVFESFKYWEESEVKEIIQENISAQNHEYWVARDWTAEAKMTTIIAFLSASNVTEINFSGVRINGNFSSWDNITIDGENQRVLKNGLPVGFSWIIPLLKNSTNKLVISHNWTARYNLTTQYRLTFK